MIQEKMKDLFVRIHTKSHAHFIIYFTLLYNLYIYIYIDMYSYMYYIHIHIYIDMYSFIAIYPRYLKEEKGKKQEGNRP